MDKEPVFLDRERDVDVDLTPTETRFAHRYVQSLNLADAARSIGVAPDAAAAAAWRIVARPRVRQFIAGLLQERNYAEGYNAERALAEYVAVAYANVLDYVTEDLSGEPRLDWQKVKANPVLGAAIAEIITDTKVIGDLNDGGYEVTRTKFKLHSKLQALDAIAKILKLMPENRLTVDVPSIGGADGMSPREIARRVAFVLSLGMRAPVEIVQEPAKTDDFADLC